MEWYYMVELIVVATFLGITVVGGSFVIVTQIRKPYVASSKATIPCVFVSLFIALLSWCWKLATRYRFAINMEYMSFMGMCHVNLKHCYHPDTSVPEVSETVGIEENGTQNGTQSGNETIISSPLLDGTVSDSKDLECARLISYAELNDISFGLTVYLPVIVTLCIFVGSYNKFTERCAESIENGNRRRSTLFGRQTISESIIFGNKSVWLGGSNGFGESSRKRKKTQNETIELKDFRPKSEASMKLNSIRGVKRKVSWTSKALDGNGTVADAVRDEKETLATPRSVNLFQEGPSVSASMLVENMPNLSRLPSRVIERSFEDNEEVEKSRLKKLRSP
ncbi:uncharacterized protein LOC134825934 [Bolinopsis microptera]|uniref:uncharacterized protein LOC134825934 n=1 Tax=Bolinopsis microptera TaxID=2820187 RepID=UPI00307A7053